MNHIDYTHAVSRPLDLNDVEVTGGFWKSILDKSRNVALPALLTEYEDRNVVKNFTDAAAGRPRSQEKNFSNYDEFLFKALEACNYYIFREGTDALRKQYERIRDIVLAVQEDDGYLNTHARQMGIEHHSKETVQELYAGGHLMQAGIAEMRAGKESVLFDAARRYIDCLIRGYGLDGAGLHRYRTKWPDHPNVEMALVELYRVTGDNKYLQFCDSVLKHSEYRGRTQMLNHAVCELLLATGGTDYYLETGDSEVWEATKRLWQDMLKKVYVTGSVGSTHRGTTHEAVGKEFALTNDQAYAETCAAISLVFWSWCMFLATGEAGYVDMLECALYNGVLSGVSLAGTEYFYENPHEYRAVSAEGSAATEDKYADFRGDDHTRKAFHSCSCCPPNVQRLFASLQQYIYAAADRNIWVNLFIDSKMKVVLSDDLEVTLQQKSNYPWDGRISIDLDLPRSAEFSLNIRVPGWSGNAVLTVNGEKVTAETDAGYMRIEREWKKGDSLCLDLPMEPRLLQSHPKNTANYGKLVVTRGPLVYCLEGIDNPGVDIFSVALQEDVTFRAERANDVFEGAVKLKGHALLRRDEEWDLAPYQPFNAGRETKYKPVAITAIPYFAWANRGKNSMITALPLANT